MYFIWRLLLWPFRFVSKNFRAFVAALIGYGVIGAAGAAALAGIYRALGAEWLLEPESWGVSAGWVVLRAMASVVGALTGGLLCQSIDRTGKGTKYLAWVIVLVGLATLYLAGDTPAEVPREGTPELTEIRTGAVAPTWVLVLEPALTVVAVLIAAKLLKRRGQVEIEGVEV